MQVELTDWQCDILGERIDEVLDDTEDWGTYSDDEYRVAIQSWINLLVGLGLIDKAEKWIADYKHICKLTIERQPAEVTIHIGYDDHISGFALTRDQLSIVGQMVDQPTINDYIVRDGERVEVSEADLFFNMMDTSPIEFKEFRDNVKFWLEDNSK